MPQYFTNETEKAIIEYNNCDCISKKNLIYNEKIYEAFSKMVENLIFTFKFQSRFQNYETLKNNTICDITIKLPLFNINKIGKSGQPAKAYSFFNTIAKNFILQELKKEARNESLQDLEDLGERNSNYIETYEILSKYSTSDNKNERKEFSKIILEFLSKRQNQALTSIEEKIIDALDYAFSNPYEVAISNKKALFSFLKQFTGLPTQEISLFLKKFKIDFKLHIQKYNNGLI